MPFRTALLLVALTGFIALSLELLWARLYYFLSATRAYAFAGMLCAYLVGLAAGSLWSIRYQERYENTDESTRRRAVARLVLWANVAGFLMAPVVSWIAALRVFFMGPDGEEWLQPYVFTYPLVAVAAGWLGTLLPLICHFAVPPDGRVGARLSYLYMANIVGSGAGSLLTGFVLMEYLPLRWIGFMLLALGVLIFVTLDGGARAWRTGLMVLALGGAATPLLYWQFWERLQSRYGWGPGRAFEQIVESRSGVITVDKESAIYGGGAYDGVIRVSPAENSWLVRAYALSALHPHPEDVLIVGLSGGSWAQITAHNPHVKRLTCVEINHSYREVIASHPVVASLLSNPKVEIITDDGRRWLERNRHRKFDAILMNTTHHWREFASNLLSREFLTMAAAHLKPGGVFQYNATGSQRAHRTALDVFDNVWLLLNNIVIFNGPPQWDNARWKPILENYVIDGQRVFDPAREADRTVLARMLALGDTAGKEPDDLAGNPLWTDDKDRRQYRLHNRAQIERACREAGAEAITDDNLGHEFRW